MPNVMDKMMTWEEQATKYDIEKRLSEQGYPTYASLLDKFALHLTADPEVVAYMIPDKGIIVVNRYLRLNQISTIIRHEILHQFLKHAKRLIDKLNGDEAAAKMLMSSVGNIAADYDISNVGYTERDKMIARNIRLNGQELVGLVTEDQHPDWVDLTYEEMLDELMKQKKKDGSESSKAEKQIQIGDRGNEAKQAAEAIERAAQIAKEKAQEQVEDAQEELDNAKTKEEKEAAQKKLNDAKQKQKDLEEVQKAADQVKKEIEKSSGQKDSSDQQDSDNSGSTTPQESPVTDYSLTPSDLAEYKKALGEIKDLLNDTITSSKISGEAKQQVKKEREEKREKERERYKNNPLNRFVQSLNGFIAKQIEYRRDKTWKKVHPTYDSIGILRPGITSSAMSKVPVVQVYYDNSGSWDDEKKQSIGAKGIDSLQKYVKDGLLKVEKYYFGNKVSTSRSDTGGGTEGSPILEKIIATKPDNVIIITDSDIGDCRDYVTVPGAVWFLFVDGVSDNLKDHLKGKQLTKSYEIDTDTDI